MQKRLLERNSVVDAGVLASVGSVTKRAQRGIARVAGAAAKLGRRSVGGPAVAPALLGNRDRVFVLMDCPKRVLDTVISTSLRYYIKP